MTRHRLRRWHVLAAASALLVAVVFGVGLRARQAPAAPQLLWVHQFGSSAHDAATTAVADASGAVVVGWTSGDLAGAGMGGPKDAFVQGTTHPAR